MLVHEQYRKCIAFLCLPSAQTTWTPVGTAFFMGVEVAPQKGALYLVTARHVVEGARSYGPLYLRLNRRDGPAEFIQIDPDAWHVAHDTDVAVMLVNAGVADTHDVGWLRPTQIATKKVLDEQKVGPGDEVFFSGLFTPFPGVARVEPLVRFGNVSMMPSEPVEIQNADGSRTHVEAFLVEARSWGGQSGSPAFVYFPATRHPGYLEMPTLMDDSSGQTVIPRQGDAATARVSFGPRPYQGGHRFPGRCPRLGARAAQCWSSSRDSSAEGHRHVELGGSRGGAEREAARTRTVDYARRGEAR